MKKTGNWLRMMQVSFMMLGLSPVLSQGAAGLAGAVDARLGMKGMTQKEWTQEKKAWHMAGGKTAKPSSISSRLERFRLAIANIIPKQLAREIHTRIQYKEQVEYLLYILDKIENQSLVDSPLAKELRTWGTPLQAAYLEYAQTNPQDKRKWVDKQMGFIKTMLHFVFEKSHSTPDVMKKNMALYTELISQMKAIDAVSIAGWKNTEWDSSASEYAELLIPAQFLIKGRRGMLGSVLDTLQDTTYSVHPGVEELFLRKRFVFLFQNAS